VFHPPGALPPLFKNTWYLRQQREPERANDKNREHLKCSLCLYQWRVHGDSTGYGEGTNVEAKNTSGFFFFFSALFRLVTMSNKLLDYLRLIICMDKVWIIFSCCSYIGSIIIYCIGSLGPYIVYQNMVYY